ncbi:putative sterigmatocystin biosynthesis P450 monooxygenase [Diplogelasinospora grovesii]|uniref:Sterigmatocystin biosynthesis P450 monooxygenase n=1 Tax=Diplogelasinospora grovesii TaxID=303347 RepID=A0AAN6S7T6_9PEZI|nr:putative sterigmatocystin biosynthesis P450 monooxygenase [Diplogelasinospora grovesii]
MILSPFSLITVVIGLLIGRFLVERIILSPLNAIPGPLYARFTGLVLKYNEFRANRTRYIHDLHQKYGPVVRVGPNEVAFASANGVKEIYCSGGSGYDKTGFYDLFKIQGRRTMFTTLNKDDHAKRKRILADRYANTNIIRSASLDGINERAGAFVRKCAESVGGGLDLYVNLHAYAFDCVTHHLFHPYGTNSLESKGDEEIMREVTFDDSLQNRLVSYYSPPLHMVLGKVLGVFGAKPRETPLADKFVLGTSSKTDTSPFTLLNRLNDSLGKGLDETDIAAECLDHMVAGIDTTGDALCFLMWELSQPRSLPYQKRLQEEALVNQGVGFDKLDFLDAVVMEGLRCWPAIPMSLPRHVPRGGRVIDGYGLPEGTVVSCQAYSVHRINTGVFPRPDEFRPERWLEEKGDAERKRLMFAFASGGRGCIGKHLALAEMKTLLREVYTRFTTLPDETMTVEDMDMSDQLISSRPAGQRCLLRFVPIQKSW